MSFHDVEFIKLSIDWGCNFDKVINKLGQKEKNKLLEYLKTHAKRDNYAKDQVAHIFESDCEEAYLFLRSYISLFDEVNFYVLFSGLESGQDVYGVSQWSVDEEDEVSENLWDATWDEFMDEYVVAADWFAEWAENHNEETAEWLSKAKNDEGDDFSFYGDGWQKFADAFPKASEEFYKAVEDM